jgi:uncharacterized paraquat-inducible protein A
MTGEPLTQNELAVAYLKSRDVMCPGCGYNRRDDNSCACPECGAHFKLEAVHLEIPHVHERTARRVFQFILFYASVRIATNAMNYINWFVIGGLSVFDSFAYMTHLSTIGFTILLIASIRSLRQSSTLQYRSHKRILILLSTFSGWIALQLVYFTWLVIRYY